MLRMIHVSRHKHKQNFMHSNGVGEKGNGHVVKTNLVIIMRVGILRQYWDYGFKIVVYLINKYLPKL